MVTTDQITFGLNPTGSNSASLIDRTEHGSGSHRRSGQPHLNGGPDPIRNGYGPDVTAFSNQISEYPVLLPALQVRDCHCCEFGTAKPTAQHHGDHGVISFAPECLTVESVQEQLALVDGQPVADLNPVLPDAFHASDAGSDIRAEETGIGGFICEPTNRRQS